jgi:hypothetical protein
LHLERSLPVTLPRTISPHLAVHLQFVASEAPLVIDIVLRPPDRSLAAHLKPPAGRLLLDSHIRHLMGRLSQSVLEQGGSVRGFNRLSLSLSCVLPALAIPRLAELPGIAQVRLREPLSPDDQTIEQMLAPGCTARDLFEALRRLKG